MKKVFILSGPSWVGKTTIWEQFDKQYNNWRIKKVITTTTRKKRDYEVDWEDYYFLSIDSFRKKIKNKDFIEYAEVHNNFYGSTYEELDNILDNKQIPLYIVDPQWVRYLKDTLKWVYDVKTIFILPPNEEILKDRLIKRGEDENSENFRIRVNESLIWLEWKDSYDYNIINNDLDRGVKEFKNIILG